jgi:hypothetical protein
MSVWINFGMDILVHLLSMLLGCFFPPFLSLDLSLNVNIFDYCNQTELG